MSNRSKWAKAKYYKTVATTNNMRCVTAADAQRPNATNISKYSLRHSLDEPQVW